VALGSVAPVEQGDVERSEQKTAESSKGAIRDESWRNHGELEEGTG
jgi:hypothetical protein